MNLNSTLEKIQKLLVERDWSLYRLAKETGIPYSSLNSLFQKNNQPTISTLEKICTGFHISMSEFFSDNPPYRDDSYALNDTERFILDNIRKLSKKNKSILVEVIDTLIKHN